MKTKFAFFLLSCFACLITACAVRKTEPFTQAVVAPSVNVSGITENPTHFSNEKVAQGHKIFMSHCYKCHTSGEAGLAPGILNKPGFAVRLQVRHGLGAMPAFKKNRISREDMNALMAYIKAQKRL